MDYTTKQRVAQTRILNLKAMFSQAVYSMEFKQAKKIGTEMFLIAEENNIGSMFRTEAWYIENQKDRSLIEATNVIDDQEATFPVLESSDVLKSISYLCEDNHVYTILKNTGVIALAKPLYESISVGNDRELDVDETSKLMNKLDVLEVIGMKDTAIKALAERPEGAEKINDSLFIEPADVEVSKINNYKLQPESVYGEVTALSPMARAFVSTGKAEQLDRFMNKYPNDISMLTGMLTYLNALDDPIYDEQKASITDMIHNAGKVDPITEASWVSFLNI